MDSFSSDANNSGTGGNSDGPSPSKKQRLSVTQDVVMDSFGKEKNCNHDNVNDDDSFHVYSLSRIDTEEYVLNEADIDSVNKKGTQCQNIEAVGTFLPDTLEDETINQPEIDKKKEDFATGDKSVLFHKGAETSSKERDAVFVPGLNNVASLVRDAKIVSSVVPEANYNVIYNKLLEHRSNENRLDVVTSNLLEVTSSKSQEDHIPTISDDQSTTTLFDDVEIVMKQFPTANANVVYDFLESVKDEPHRVQKVIRKMGLEKQEIALSASEFKPAMQKKNGSVLDDPALANDPLFKDMRTVAKVFPDHDRNEIYALLEANVGKNDRLQIVINELLQTDANKNAVDKHNSSLNIESVPNETSSSSSVTDLTLTEAGLEEDVEHLRLLFPDCDPNYLFQKLEEMKDVNRRLILAEELTDKKDYPKLKDRLEMEKLAEEKKKKCQRTFTEEEFFYKFPDPQKTFGDGNKVVSDMYKAHAKASIINDFLMIKKDYLVRVLEEHNHHFYLASKKINDGLVRIPFAERKNHKRFMRRKRGTVEPMPMVTDEYFFHEYWFTHNELKLEDYVKQKELARQMKVEEAREKGELYECGCCYDDECLFEDLASCPEGHLFCKVCVVRSTEAAFGEMKTRFPCLTGSCDQVLPLSTLQGIIPANFFSKIVSRMQEEEVLQAQIPDLVTCPFCPFATVMTNPDDKVLKCLNPECLKESCRLCREESHIPLKCNEVESRAGTRMRTYIENKVAEAVMRKCDKCGKRFLKDAGCNKMTCVCGATSCYYCKEQDIGYEHFNSNTRCSQTDPNKIHERDMEEAAHKAMTEYLLEHPEAAELDLNSDLKDIIQNYDPTTDIFAVDEEEVDDSDLGEWDSEED